MTRILPETTGNEVIVEVAALPTGHITHPLRWIFEDDKYVGKSDRFPDFSFFIKHPSGKKMLFDLGIRKALHEYPPMLQALYGVTKPKVEREAHEILQQDGKISPDDVDTVILSHLHWDHIGNIRPFSRAELLLGPESKALAVPGYPSNPKSPLNEDTILNAASVRELSYVTDDWRPLGPFPKAHDFFGDGSFYIVDAPGHMQGHLGALARTGIDEYVFMGGDCCHHRLLLSSDHAQVSYTCGPAGLPGFHKDLELAKETINRVKQLDESQEVLVVLAHDNTLENNMPLFPKTLNGWKKLGQKYTHNRVL